MSFTSLGLSTPLLQAIEKQGYNHPSPIQEKAIPFVLEGKDLLGAAQTGTGKTAAFSLPLLQRLTANAKKVTSNRVRALILTPTRELAAQVADNVQSMSSFLPIKSAVAFGGVGINPQMKRLRAGVDVLVATPGRLMDLYQQNAIKFDQLEMLVLDEADRMLDMGFIHDIKRILKLLPTQRQTLLFSATFSSDIIELATSITRNPVQVSTTPANTTVEKIEQRLIPVDKSRKNAALIQLVKRNNWRQVLVFSRTKHGANRIATKLSKANIPSDAIHGNKSQGARTRALANFKSGEIDVLVATDIAARGIDISELPIVVNFDLPNTAADYVHRIGRTGRAGSSGQAWSFVSVDELQQLKDIETLIQTLLPREQLTGFEPQQPVPETSLAAPKKPKKPKKPKLNSQSNHKSRRNRTADGSNTSNSPDTRRPGTRKHNANRPELNQL